MSRASVHPAPVLSLGNQKSGTTAVAALLAKSTGKSVTLDIFYRFKGEPLARILKGELTLAQFVEKYPYYFSTDIIKEPSLTFLIDELRSCFPRGRMLTVIRDPRDNIRSILNRLDIPGDLQQLGDDHLEPLAGKADWKMILDGTLYGHAGSNYVETLARRWTLAADAYLRHTDEIILVRYEDFVSDKVGTIETLARSLGLEPIHDISADVNRQYERRGNARATWPEFFGRENLAIIETVCRSHMVRLGYRVGAVAADSMEGRVPG